MLSEDKVKLLTQKVEEWGTENNVPLNVQRMVIEMGVENPRTPEEKEAVCAAHLWASGVIEWYDKFISYLEQSNEAPKAKKVDTLLLLKTIQQLINQLVEALEHEQ